MKEEQKAAIEYFKLIEKRKNLRKAFSQFMDGFDEVLPQKEIKELRQWFGQNIEQLVQSIDRQFHSEYGTQWKMMIDKEASKFELHDSDDDE